MIKNYLKIAFRGLWKHKLFTLINIAGLSIGVSAALVIYLIVSYDFSFEKLEKDSDRIYRVVSDYTFAGDAFHASGVPSAMPLAVKNEIPGLDLVIPVRLWHNDFAKVTLNDKDNRPVIFKNQDKIVFADANYFTMLPFTWMGGSPETSLEHPYQVVLAESKARIYFPDLSNEEIIGKELIFNDTIRTTVSGIVKNPSQNTDFTFEIFISKATVETPRLKPDAGREWRDAYPEMQLFIKLSAQKSVNQVESQINALYRKNHKDPAGITGVHHLQPLSDLHFNTKYGNFNQRLANKPTLYGLLAVAVFLLLLACINFINLSTARASQRAKEIGVRKAMGSSKNQLVFQFLTETFLLCLTATTISIFLTPLLLKIFADFIPPGLHFNLTQQPGVILFLVALIFLVTILSGFYPAMVLSSYQPVLMLKGKINSDKQQNIGLRRSLSIFQLVIAQIFIIATIFVSKQISFSLNKDLGFKNDAIVYFQTNWNADPKKRQVLLNRLKAIPEIRMISLSNNPPSSLTNRSNIIKYNAGEKQTEAHVQTKLADTNYIRLYQIKLQAGTNLPLSDTIGSVLINETCVRNLGIARSWQAVGKYVAMDGKKVLVVGVVKDFHQGSFHEAIKPLVISSKIGDELTFNIALRPQNSEGTTWKTAITKIEKSYKEVYPDDDFDFHFLDDSIAKYYTADQNISRLLTWLTGICIFVSCLGLLGLVICTTNQRIKEIGIRKVIGASVSQLVLLLSNDFLRLVFASFVVAVPIAWYGVHRWLENFAYKTTLDWWIFLAGGGVMFLFALIILCSKTVKAALANPVTSLRSE